MSNPIELTDQEIVAAARAYAEEAVQDLPQVRMRLQSSQEMALLLPVPPVSTEDPA